MRSLSSSVYEMPSRAACRRAKVVIVDLDEWGTRRSLEDSPPVIFVPYYQFE